MESGKRRLQDIRRNEKVWELFVSYSKTTIMRTMKNFAAQQLSKRQMNEVKGGGLWFCRSFNSKGEVTGEFNVSFKDGQENFAKEAVAQAIGPGQVADCWVVE